MRAAFERARLAPAFGQHRARRLDMHRLAGMRGAGERDLRAAQAITIRRAALDERQRLQRLDGGARKHWRFDIAKRQHGSAVRIADGDRAAMDALDPRAARDFGEYGIARVSHVAAFHGASRQIAFPLTLESRHCEERGDEAICGAGSHKRGLLRLRPQ